MSRNALERLTDARPAALDENIRALDLDRILAQPRSTAARPRPRLRLRLALGAAAVTAAVVGVTVLTSGPAEQRPAPPAATAQQVLLAAAERTAAQHDATSGRYWYHGHEGGSLHHFTLDGEEFDVVSRSVFEYYDAQDGSRSFMVYQTLGGLPATDRDAETIKRIGSPDFYPYDGPQPEGKKWGVSAVEGKRAVSDNPTNGRPFGGMTLTFDQLAALPADPAELRSVITTTGKNQAMNFIESAFYLTSQPIRPEVRAAIYRLLADQPGVRSLGTITDRKGRKVEALAWDAKFWFERKGHPIPAFSESGTGNGWIESRALIDPDSGTTLGMEWYVKTLPTDAEAWLHVGQLVGYEYYLESGYTDEPPAGR